MDLLITYIFPLQTHRLKQEVLGMTNRLLSSNINTDRIENDAPNNFSIIECVFTAAVTFLPSCWLAKTKVYAYRQSDGKDL
jgi:hypothetical protein